MKTAGTTGLREARLLQRSAPSVDGGDGIRVLKTYCPQMSDLREFFHNLKWDENFLDQFPRLKFRQSKRKNPVRLRNGSMLPSHYRNVPKTANRWSGIES